jgi:hypothetical protein
MIPEIPNNKLIITVKNGKLSMSTSNPIGILDIIQIFHTLLLGAMNDVLKYTNEADREAVKADLYDRENFAASSLLHMFAPEYDRNPDLTTKAILKAENEIIEEGLKAKSSGLKVLK